MRHLLDVWICAGEPARRCANLAKVSMQTLRYGIDQLNHVLAVTRQRLLHCAVLKQRLDYWILSCQRLHFPISS